MTCKQQPPLAGPALTVNRILPLAPLHVAAPLSVNPLLATIDVQTPQAGRARSSFDQRTQDVQDVGTSTTLTVKARKRRMIMLQRAREILQHLPAEDEQVHLRVVGRCDMMILAAGIIERTGWPVRLRLATLGYNHRNLVEMIRLLDEAQASQISLLCGRFFLIHNRALFEETRKQLGKRGSSAAYDLTHVKVVTLDTPSGPYALEGSANLRSNGYVEQFLLTRDRAAHDWHASWIDQRCEQFNCMEQALS